VSDKNTKDADGGGNLDDVVIHPPTPRRILKNEERRGGDDRRVARVHVVPESEFNPCAESVQLFVHFNFAAICFKRSEVPRQNMLNINFDTKLCFALLASLRFN
jgi:hypothetical protein